MNEWIKVTYKILPSTVIARPTALLVIEIILDT